MRKMAMHKLHAGHDSEAVHQHEKTVGADSELHESKDEASHDMAPELDPTSAEEIDEQKMNADEEISHPGMGYDEKEKMLESLTKSHTAGRSPMSLHEKVTHNMKADLHSMKGKKMAHDNKGKY